MREYFITFVLMLPCITEIILYMAIIREDHG